MSGGEPLSESVEMAISSTAFKVYKCEMEPGMHNVREILRAFAREIQADHHALGRWVECKRCTQFFQDDENFAVENARLAAKLTSLESVDKQLTDAREQARSLAEALEKIGKSNGGPGPRQFRIDTLAIVGQALADYRLRKEPI